jgi:hypothetical protein
MSTVSEQSNPYAPPTVRVADVCGADSEAEAIRREHIKREASVRSIGLLYYMVSVVFGFATLGEISMMAARRELTSLALLFYLAFCGLLIVLGRGVRKLRSWARITAIVLTGIAILLNISPLISVGYSAAAPVMTGILINAYILYLLLSQKGRRIFVQEYQGIVAATPHIKYRTSIVACIALGLLLLFIVFAIVAVSRSG